MSTINARLGRLTAGVGGALLLVSLFLPWSELQGENLSGWETLSLFDLFVAITGLCGIVAALTGGRFGFFRPDLSFNAMTDIFGVVVGSLLVWFVAADFPAHANRKPGVYLALAAAWIVATGAGDFRVRTLFPRGAQADLGHD
jgi:hypothetical protein